MKRRGKRRVGNGQIQLADLVITDQLVVTPVGALNRAATRWMAGHAAPVRETPAWAITMAILLVPCTGFLSLLLLLVKEPGRAQTFLLMVDDGRTEYRTTVYCKDYAQYLVTIRLINDLRAPRAAWPAPAPYPYRALPGGAA